MNAESRSVLCFSLLILLEAAALGQQAPATVSFTLEFVGSNPSHYEIQVASDGQGSYSSNGRIDEHSEAVDGGAEEFRISDTLRERIFDLARRAHYFSGKVDAGKKNIANTGTKTLAYKDATHDSKATYNYSGQQPIEQLTVLFQGLSTTLEYGRRLAYFHKYEKLALDNELKKMEELQRGNNLPDVKAVAPQLTQIVNDTSVMNVSRARAQRLLASQTK
ncbi:MAG TPA: hypothetical protein VH596_15850 [Terriglobales bacterium]|jgi:hypothetical protein